MSPAIHSTPRIKRMAYAIQLICIASALLLNAQAPALAQESAAAAAATLDFQVPAGGRGGGRGPGGPPAPGEPRG